MTSICLYFEVHQPMRLNHFSVFNIGANHDRNSDYFDQKLNQQIFEKVAKKCYIPTNKLMLNLLNEHPEFKISYSFSGVVLDQFENYSPEVLNLFQ